MKSTLLRLSAYSKTMSKLQKPEVLVIGKINYAHEALNRLLPYADVIDFQSNGRTGFLNDLATGKYSNVKAIYHGSAKGIDPFDEEIARALPESVKFISHHGAGYDSIHIDHFTKRGIQISNTPGVVTNSTATTHLYLILGAIRNFGQASLSVRNGNWIKEMDIGHDTEGKVLGIVGMGSIGQALRDRAIPFGFKVIYYNRKRLSPELEKDSEYVDSLDELLGKSDIVALNLPLNAGTRHIINKERLSKLKKGAIITNSARGPVIDENALVDALNEGRVGGVALDVYENEPKIHQGLLDNPKAILLPHAGTYTLESRKSMEELVLKNIFNGLKHGKLITLVPEQINKF